MNTTFEYKEKTLPSGDIITMTALTRDHPPNRPWEVTCWPAEGNHRWTVYFATKEEAEVEYRRFD